MNRIFRMWHAVIDVKPHFIAVCRAELKFKVLKGQKETQT